MWTGIKRVLSRKLRVKSLGLPVWAILGLAGIAAFGGQTAVGAVLNGSVSGQTGLTVEQSVVLASIEVRDFLPSLLCSISPRDNQLRVIDTVSVVETTASTTITLSGQTVEGGNGIASDPTEDNKLYAILKLAGQAGHQLVTIDPETGVAASIGDTSDRFAGIAFDLTGQLYGVTGDGAGVPETLYTINKSTGVPTGILTLGAGNDGETIGFNPDDGLIYHASGEGIPNVNEIFETINPNTLITTSITLKGLDYAEATALTYEGGDNFFLADLGRRLYRINTDGFSQLVGIIDHDSKGLVPFGLAHVDDALAVMNDDGTHFTAALETHVGDTLMLILELKNTSDEDANATLQLKIPEGMVADAMGVGAIKEAQIAENVWLLNVPATISDGTLRIILKSLDDHKPGFHEVEGKIVQISG